MDWYFIMTRELQKAGTGAVISKVPDSRRASAASLMKLDREIAPQIRENKAMSIRSKLYASSMFI